MIFKEDFLLYESAFQMTERLDTEDSIICHLIHNPDRILEIAEYFPPTCLAITANRVAYMALIEMAKLDYQIDAVQLEIHLDREKKLHLIGGSVAIAVWNGNPLVFTPTKESVDKLIDYLIEIAKRKSLIQSLDSLKVSLLDLSIPYEQLSKLAESCTIEFLKGKKEVKGLEPISMSISDSIERILDRSYQQKSGESGEAISTGYCDLDKLTGGWQPSDLIVVAGRTSMGKSAMVQNTLLAVAQNHPVAFFSLEMSTHQMNRRFISIVTEIEANKLRDGNLTEAEYERIISSGERLRQLKYWGCDNSSPNMDFIATECRKLKAKHGTLGGIAIDHVGLMVENHDNPRADINRITKKSKALAMELNCPVFLVSQINRSCEGRNEKRPQLSDLAESGRLEQDANVVVMLYRDEYYNPESPDKGIAEIIIRKNRDGECGTQKLTYRANITKFENYVSQKYV